MHAGDGRVVSNFIIQALANEPITIYGDGNQTRSFCYVDDIIDALDKLMSSSDEVTGPINLGNPFECTMLELAQAVIALTGSRSSISFGSRPSDDPERRRPDISLAGRVLDWQPRTPLHEGLERTIAYFRRSRFSAHKDQSFSKSLRDSWNVVGEEVDTGRTPKNSGM
jgi:UDP-glucuronate decarboxylase